MAGKKRKTKKVEIKEEKTNKYLNIIFSFLFLSVALVITIYQLVGKSQNDSFKKEIVDSVGQKVEETIKEQESSKYPDYSSLSTLNHLNIISNFTSWTPDSKLENDKTKMAIVLDKGRLSKGYVYIKASISSNPLTRSESVYLKMNNRGGHLVKNRSLPVPGSDRTELLFPLDSVFFYSKLPYTDSSPQFSVNFLAMFFPNSKVRIDTFISSLKPAVLEDVSIFYDCEVAGECSLSLLELD